MAITNNIASSVVDHKVAGSPRPPATATAAIGVGIIWPWHEAVCLIAFLGSLEETQEYVQVCKQRLANKESPTLPTGQQL